MNLSAFLMEERVTSAVRRDGGQSELKILYHHRTGSRDGQAVHIEEMISALRANSAEVTVVEPRSTANLSFGGEAQNLTGLRNRLPGPLAEALEFAYNIIAFLKLRKAYHSARPDVIYERYNLFLVAGVWLKKLYGIPLLVEVNAPLFHERSKFGGLSLHALAHWSERYAWRNADYILPVTTVLADMVIAEGVSSQRVVVIPNGVNKDLLRFAGGKEAAKQRVGMQGRLVLGFTGFVRTWHGLDQILDLLAAPGQKDSCLLVVGDGPARKDLEARALQLGVGKRVRFTGVVSRQEVAEHIAAFDIALQPAANEYASPLKLFEYMVMGCAIVAPDQPNIREVLTDQRNALLFSPGKPDELLAKIQALVGNRELREQIGHAAADTIRRHDYTWHRNARKVLGLARVLTTTNRGSLASSETGLR
jgi:glycosyltransferase involved in cell wall biosynthesis